jgi:hypothetical protein
MKQLAIGIAILAIGVGATSAARADFAVVKFKDKSCRAWVVSKAQPIDAGWKYLWVSVPTWDVAQTKGAYAMKRHWCATWAK